MKRLWLKVIVVLLFVAVSTASFAAPVPGTYFPYGHFLLRTAPIEDPTEGMGFYYSALKLGMGTVMWNPASLSAVGHTETSLAFVSDSNLNTYTKKYNTTDFKQNFGGLSYVNLSFYYTGDQSVTATKERENTGTAYNQIKGTGVNFKQAIKINDWCAVGFISRGDNGGVADISGSAPLVSKFNANYTGTTQTVGNMFTIGIGTGGIATITITPEGGTGYTQTLAQPLWSGFINQTSTVPYTAICEGRNDVTFSAPYTFSTAINKDNLAVGLNFTPVTANCNINNNVRVVITDGTPDMSFYQPNFDPSSEQSMMNWLQDPNQYGSEVGYKRNVVRIPAGEVVGEGVYKGFYQATAAQLDLGLTYNLGPHFTFGMAMANAGGATFDFRGNGIMSYVNTRVGSFDAPSLDPSQQFTWDMFNDTFSTLEGTQKYYLEDQLNSPLPKRTRIGFSFDKPFLIAIDYEINQTPIKFKYQDNSTSTTRAAEMSNISFIRFGLESQVGSLPWITRLGLTLMPKPSFTNLDATTQNNINTLFKYKVLPVGLTLGEEFNFWGTKAGCSLGFDATPLISLLQTDAAGMDVGRSSYYSLYAARDAWKLTYMAALDAGSTANAYYSKPAATRTFGTDDLRFIQTVAVNYKF